MSPLVSRILLKMAIYLGAALPLRSSHLPGETGPVLFPSTVLLRIEFTAAHCRQSAGRSLTPPFHPYRAEKNAAVYLCCTRPDVAIGGRYPLFLPCGARTFLTHSLSAHARGHSEGSLYTLSRDFTRPCSPSCARRSARPRCPRRCPASSAYSSCRPRRSG